MTTKFLFFIFMVWAGVALFSQVASLGASADSEALNTLASGELINVEDVTIGSNPLNTATGAWKFARTFFTKFYEMATFATPFWEGDMQVVRYYLLATLGLAALTTIGWETLRWLRGG